ncbi:MAG: BrnA antitoxin family protein [Waterburya sp.]
MNTVRKNSNEILPMNEKRARELQTMLDEEIDCSEIPELDEEFFQNAKLIERKPRTKVISLRIDLEVLEWFRSHAQEKEYQSFINNVLRTYVHNQQQK